MAGEDYRAQAVENLTLLYSSQREIQRLEQVIRYKDKEIRREQNQTMKVGLQSELR
jgi:hypothetical protein